MDPETLNMLAEAAKANDLLLIAVALAAVVVPLVLKVLGKNVPGLDPVLRLIVSVVGAFRKKKDPPPAPDEPQGVSNLVPLKRDDEK